MKKNMGNVDKTIRIVIGLLIGLLAYTGVIEDTLAIVLLVLAAVFILTSLISFCPLYAVFGFKTCPNKG